jgi:hypothetical protein
MSIVKFTKTATFLFPLLDIPKVLFECNIKDRFGRTKHSDRFLNAYLTDTNVSRYNKDTNIFVVIRNYRDVDFDRFYSTIQAFPNYVDDYDNKECLVLVFKVPEKNLPDYHLLKQGQYSQISNNAKKLILANNYYTGKAFTLPLILNKANALKESWEDRLSFIGKDIYSPADLGEQEVWPILNEADEILNETVLNSFSNKIELLPTGEF